MGVTRDDEPRSAARETGRRNEGCAILSDVYGWFTEGFDTADLKDAKALFGTIATLTRPTATIPNAFRLFSCHLPN
jgi:hypothetical protein